MNECRDGFYKKKVVSNVVHSTVYRVCVHQFLVSIVINSTETEDYILQVSF